MANKIIFVSGGSASGKTTLSKQIIEHFGKKALHISQDSFYKTTNHSNSNFDIPSAMDFERMKDVIKKLKNNQKIKIPRYDFITHSVADWYDVEPKDIVIFEGLFTFYDDQLANLADFKIFVDTPADTRLSRRILRDVKERGRTIESVIQRWISHVQPSYQKYIQPTKNFADVVIPWDNIKTKSIQALLITINHIGDDITKLLDI